MIVREIHLSFSAATGRLSQALQFEYHHFLKRVNGAAKTAAVMRGVAQPDREIIGL